MHVLCVHCPISKISTQTDCNRLNRSLAPLLTASATPESEVRRLAGYLVISCLSPKTLVSSTYPSLFCLDLSLLFLPTASGSPSVALTCQSASSPLRPSTASHLKLHKVVGERFTAVESAGSPLCQHSSSFSKRRLLLSIPSVIIPTLISFFHPGNGRFPQDYLLSSTIARVNS